MKQRDEVAREFRRTHFSFGNDSALNRSTTTYGQNYAAYKEQSQTSAKKVDGKTLRVSHFTLGTDPIQDLSSYINDYSAKKIDSVKLNKEVLSDLRATHYELGYNPRDYTTVNKQTYVAPERSQSNDVGGTKRRGKPASNVLQAVNKSYQAWNYDAKREARSKSLSAQKP